VLKTNFEKMPSGPRKIANGEYVLIEAARNRQIDLSTHWNTCFMPGQRVEMRMTFQHETRRLNSCPSCAYESDIRAEEDVECVKCGVTFRRTIQTKGPSPLFSLLKNTCCIVEAGSLANGGYRAI